MNINDHTLDTLVTVGQRTTQGGAIATVGSWLLSSEAGIAAGILIGVSGLAMNWYYSRKRDQREQAEHEQRMKLGMRQ